MISIDNKGQLSCRKWRRRVSLYHSSLISRFLVTLEGGRGEALYSLFVNVSRTLGSGGSRGDPGVRANPPLDLVSEPDPRKIEKEGLAHRPGWKCTLRPV